MAPHARMAFCHVDQNALESFHVDLAKVPGVRNKKGLWVVPYNAVHTVNALVGKWGAEVSAAAWVVPPKPATTWEQVYAELAAKSEVRDWVIDGFLTQYQKDSIVFGWPCLGNHFWHTTGAGKTLTGLITALSVPGPVVIVTRASSRIQYAREVERFLNVRAYVVRPASHPGPLRVQGETYNEWRARHKGMYTRDEMKQAWESRKEQFGIDPTRGLVDYLRDCKGTRPFIVVGWEALKSNLKELCSIQPGTVIFDECFPAGTPVRVREGLKPIERIEPGEEVLSIDPSTGEMEWQVVRRCMSYPQKSRGLIEVEHEHGYLTCTPNHKVWVKEVGYVEAGKLLPGDHLCILREGGGEETKGERSANPQVLLSRVLRQSYAWNHLGYERREGVRVLPDELLLSGELGEAFLQQVMLREVEDGSARGARSGLSGRKDDAGPLCRRGQSTAQAGSHQADAGSNAGKQSDEGLHDSGESESDAQGDGARACATSGEWHRAHEVRTAAGGPDDATAVGCRCAVLVSGRARSGTEELQDRLGRQDLDAGSRGRWLVPSCSPPEGTGCKEGHDPEPLGLDSDPGDQRGSGGGPGWGGCTAHVYDLEVEKNHNYFASGVLVSNSHRGKSTKRWDIEHLADLPADEEAAKKQALDEARRAKASDGFIKMTEEGRKMFTPVVNTASAAATLARAASHRICTTATPVKDRVRDLWAQLDLAEPNAWGSSTEWRKRHCLDPITPVLMGDGSYRSIGELSEGDEVIGWSSVEGKRFLHRTRVLATSRREAEIIQLRMVSGKVIRCTRDHHWLYSLAAKIRPYRPVCCWSETEQRWNRSLNHLLRVGPAPVGWAAQWTELPSGQGHVWWPKTAQDSAYATAGYKLGYIRGLIDGDGHQRINDNTYEIKTDWGKARRRERKSKPKAYQMTIFQKEILPLTRACRYAQELSLRTTGVKPTADGQGYTLGFYSKEAYRRLSTTGWDSAAQSYKRGWLAGMYDAEGHAEVISQYEAVNPKNHRYLGNWLREFGFSVRSWSQGVAILGGKWELLRFFDLVRPVFTYKLDALFKRKPNFRFGKTEKDGIRSAFPLKGMHEVVSIQTETGNYIAAGYASKNCDMKPGVYGGMDDRGSSHVDELNQRLKGVAHILSYAETHMHLPPKRRQSVYIAPEEQTKPAAGFSQQFREAQKRGPASVLEAKLQQAASGKRKAVLSMVEDHVSSKQKVVIFTGRRRDCDELGELLRKQSYIRTNQVKVWAAHGDQSTQVRQAIVDDYMAHPGPCVFVGTGDAFGESLNIDDTDAAFFVMLPYTPGQLRQWEGRFHRASTKKPVIIYYVIAEGTIDEHVADILITKLPAVEAIAKDAELGEASDVLAGFDPNETPEQFAAAVLEGLDLWDT